MQTTIHSYWSVWTSPDDAAVWQLDRDNALILTTDFFTPVVDDAYDYGAIAAANSLSDVYAMGGEPFLALNITAFPPDLDISIQQDILRGAAEKARDAGVVIAGGHSIRDKEPKFGLVVLGRVRIQDLLTKGAAQPGDHLFITKPLGFGVITTALKQEKADIPDVLEAVNWMKTLNRNASRLGSRIKPQSCHRYYRLQPARTWLGNGIRLPGRFSDRSSKSALSDTRASICQEGVLSRWCKR